MAEASLAPGAERSSSSMWGAPGERVCRAGRAGPAPGPAGVWCQLVQEGIGARGSTAEPARLGSVHRGRCLWKGLDKAVAGELGQLNSEADTGGGGSHAWCRYAGSGVSRDVLQEHIFTLYTAAPGVEDRELCFAVAA